MFNGPEVNQRRSDKQNFGFVSNGIGTARQDATGGNNNGVLSVRVVNIKEANRN